MTAYRIIIQGLLDAEWSSWFEGSRVTPDPFSGVTCIEGEIHDQAELFGIINQIRDLNLTILLLEQPADSQ
jgi:hypothetical protein